MSLIAKDTSKTFIPAPEGLHQSVCCDVVDLGEVTDQFGTRACIRVYWQIDEVNPENERRYLVTKRYTNSLHEKANLRKDLESWRGKAFAKEELTLGFDLLKLLGVNGQLNIVHNHKGEDTYANIVSITPLGKGQAKITVSADYVRVIDRENDLGGPPTHDTTGDDTPF